MSKGEVILVFDARRRHGTPDCAAGTQGIGLLSENRKEEGLMLNRSVADNLTVTRFAPFTRFGFISGGRQRTLRQRMDGAPEHVARAGSRPGM